MITIFCTPKNFEGIFDIIQTNSLNSWRALNPDIEIIIFGDSKGADKIARSINAIHIPEVEKSSNGVPILSDMFNKAQEIAKNDILTFINADIILPFNFVEPIKIIKTKLSKFLIVGYRWDIDITKKINFNNFNYNDVLWSKLIKKAKRHSSSGIDYFIFKKNTFPNLPNFVVGRPGYDNWIIWNARRRLIPVIDISKTVKVLHQNHHFNFHNLKKDPKIYLEEDGLTNRELINGNELTLNDTNYFFYNSILKKKTSDTFKNRDLGNLEKLYPELYYFFNWYKRLKRRFFKII
jgi:hypothetical protein